MKFKGKLLSISLFSAVIASNLSGLEVNLTKNIPYVDVNIDGKTVRIERIQDTKHKLRNSYTKTSRPCPPFCVQKLHPIDGIETVSEIDVIKFLKNDVPNGKGLLIDARLPQWYIQGTIPGSINVPFSVLSVSLKSKYINQMLQLFGAEQKDGKWDFSNAMTLMVFDNGPWCQQGVAAMKNLVKLGYPKDKIKYYRGGMQYWQILGINVYKPTK